MGTATGTRGYPKTRFQLIDQTYIPELPVESVNNQAIIMVAYTSDKGSEAWEMIRGLSNFTKTKGGINYEKHGQAQLTIAEVLRSGGLIFGKRMVSDDATLANATIRARVVQSNDVSYVYTYMTAAEGAQTLAEAATSGKGDFDYNDEDANDFPLFTIAAAGRGGSSLFFRIAPEYSNARSTTVLRYACEIYEDGELLENIVFSLNPDYIVNNVAQSIQRKINSNSAQIQCQQFTDGIYAFARYLLNTATINGETTDLATIMTIDMLNGLDRRGGTTVGGIVGSAVDPEDSTDEWNANMPSDIADYVVDLAAADGLPLSNGDYGTMTDVPMDHPEEVTKLLLGAWGKTVKSRQYDPVIYDLDAFKPDAVIDANYDVSVKNAIIDVCDFRQDMVFLCDLGLNVDTLEGILDAANYINPSRFCAVYHNYCTIIDPYEKKEREVTITHLLATKFVKHLNNGAHRAFAGISNGITFPEIIPGSLNFEPRITPDEDQKQQLADKAVNYISYYDGLAVMETEYTNYDQYTQCSFLNNILAVQEVIKDIRTTCPKIRYAFMNGDGDEFDNYTEDVNAVIARYQSNFKSIELQYMEDEAYIANKVYYAVLYVSFRDFVQEEFFKIIAIN